MTRERGHTLVEVLVTGTLLIFLLGMILTIYSNGSSALRKTEAQSDLQGTVQTIIYRLSRDLQRGSPAGLSVAASEDAVSVPVPDAFGFDDNHDLNFGRYIVYYLQDGMLYRREVEIDAGNPAHTSALPIEDFQGLTLEDYRRDGVLVGRGIVEFKVSAGGGETVSVTLTAEQRRYGKPTPDTFRLTTGLQLHN